MGGSGGDAAAGSASSTGNGGGKRGRDPEDEVYLDNLHSSKRYLSEVLFFSPLQWITSSCTVVPNTSNSYLP